MPQPSEYEPGQKLVTFPNSDYDPAIAPRLRVPVSGGRKVPLESTVPYNRPGMKEHPVEEPGKDKEQDGDAEIKQKEHVVTPCKKDDERKDAEEVLQEDRGQKPSAAT